MRAQARRFDVLDLTLDVGLTEICLSPGMGSAASEDQDDALHQIGNLVGEEADQSDDPVPLLLLTGGWGFGNRDPT